VALAAVQVRPAAVQQAGNRQSDCIREGDLFLALGAAEMAPALGGGQEARCGTP
jgi:hypothetical protein